MHAEFRNKKNGFRLLLNEDEELIRDALHTAFQIKGLELVAVETAEEGLELIRKSSFDVVICDYRLPGMDGLKFFLKAYNLPAGSIRILISGQANCCTRMQADSVDIHLFLEKPFSLKALLTFVLSHLPSDQEHTQEVAGGNGL
jgi:two-component system nitrogen regulation response regulator NtrX